MLVGFLSLNLRKMVLLTRNPHLTNACVWRKHRYQKIQ
jgi:hypothetical protein